MPPEERRARDVAWAAILKVAAKLGTDRAWAAQVYKTRFGEAREA